MNLQLKLLKDAKQTSVERVHPHSFLKRCRAKSISLDKLKLFLVHQGLYSSYFKHWILQEKRTQARFDYYARSIAF
ncbi:MAG: hypothetical protein KGI91_10725 [Burkholderiales bacterium]|nr:hypothetical protein [Burkholderiales bacterium]